MQSIVSVLGEGSICIKDLINTSSPNGQLLWGLTNFTSSNGQARRGATNNSSPVGEVRRGSAFLNENPNNPRQVRRGTAISTLQANKKGWFSHDQH